MKKILSVMFFCFSFIPMNSFAFSFGAEIQECITAPDADGEQQTACEEKAVAESEEKLSQSIKKLRDILLKNYNSPYTLSESDSRTINDVFWRKFTKSQDYWVSSRNQMCAAQATLVGEWASSQYEIKNQCLITSNNKRTEEIKKIYSELSG